MFGFEGTGAGVAVAVAVPEAGAVVEGVVDGVVEPVAELGAVLGDVLGVPVVPGAGAQPAAKASEIEPAKAAAIDLRENAIAVLSSFSVCGGRRVHQKTNEGWHFECQGCDAVISSKTRR
jgi:hypothetical protein